MFSAPSDRAARIQLVGLADDHRRGRLHRCLNTHNGEPYKHRHIDAATGQVPVIHTNTNHRGTQSHIPAICAGTLTGSSSLSPLDAIITQFACLSHHSLINLHEQGRPAYDRRSGARHGEENGRKENTPQSTPTMSDAPNCPTGPNPLSPGQPIREPPRGEHSDSCVHGAATGWSKPGSAGKEGDGTHPPLMILRRGLDEVKKTARPRERRAVASAK